MDAKRMTAMMTALCLTILWILSCPFFPLTGASAEAGEKAKLTLMIYMVGSNLETDYGAASRTIDRIAEAAANGPEINLLMMTGGSKSSLKWNAGKSHIWEVRSHRSRTLWNEELMNMGEPETLSFFLNYCAENRPAERYALILWGHGNGPLGFGYDELFEMDPVTMEEFAQAMEKSPFSNENKLAWLAYDASFMGNLEVLQAVAPYTEIMIADEFEVPTDGLNYDYLNEADILPDGEKISRCIIDSYLNAYSQTDPIIAATAIRTEKAEQILQLYHALLSALKEDKPEDYETVLEKSRIKMMPCQSAFYDLGTLAESSREYFPQESDDLIRAIEEATVYHRNNLNSSEGLSTIIN